MSKEEDIEKKKYDFEDDSEIFKWLSSEITLQPRSLLKEYTNFDHAVELIKESKQIIFILGAGISVCKFINKDCEFTKVSCGIPDFRSREGLFESIKKV
jgi:hypothetical protein